MTTHWQCVGRVLLQGAIRGYQRWISPYKGFCCAYRQHTGRASCSQLGFRVVRRHGVVGGLGLLRQRMALCGVAHRRYTPLPAPRYRPQAQRGDCACDLPGGCDLPFDLEVPDGKSLGRCCSTCADFASCGNCHGCDGFDRKRGRDDERTVHLPPRPLAAKRPSQYSRGASADKNQPNKRSGP